MYKAPTFSNIMDEGSLDKRAISFYLLFVPSKISRANMRFLVVKLKSAFSTSKLHRFGKGHIEKQIVYLTVSFFVLNVPKIWQIKTICRFKDTLLVCVHAIS